VKVRGTVVYAERKVAPGGGKYWRVGLKGEDGTTRFFNTSSFVGRIGEVATIEVSEREWKKAMGGEAEAARPVRAAVEASGRDVLILKQVALKSAVEYASSRPQESWKAEDILALAERFVEWLVVYLPPVEPEGPEPEEEEVIEL